MDLRNRGRLDKPTTEEFERLYSYVNALRSTVIGDSGDPIDQSGATDAWVVPTFIASNFFASSAMTWTVAVANLTTWAYHLVGQTMTVSFSITSTTVGGTPSTTLYLAIPASKVAKRDMWTACRVVDNGTATTGFCAVTAGTSAIAVTRSNGANYAAAAATTSVQGTITFEVQ